MGSLGVVCTAATQCASGFCADGICCNAACTGNCQACTAAKKGSGSNGTCGNIPDGVDPDNECMAGACNGSGVCLIGTAGRPCAGASDCYYDVYCVEGVCCNTQCSSTCMSCLAAKKGSGTNGTCGTIAAGTDPENECTNGACGGTGTCRLDVGLVCTSSANCLSGHCIDGVCCESACAGTCEACSLVKKIAYNAMYNGSFRAYYNLGNGYFGNPYITTTSSVPSYGSASMVELADVNGDAKLDLLILGAASNVVAVRFNNGSGAFGAQTSYATGTGPAYVAAADLTGDGKLDLAVVNTSGNSLSILRNNGNGTFAAKVDYPTGTSPIKVVAADMNDDNIKDLVVGADGNRNIDIAYNQGNGTFVVADFTASTVNPTDYVVKDFTGDGKADFAIFGGSPPNYVMSVMLNQGSGAFAPTVNYPRINLPSNPQASLDTKDVEGDGKPDLCLFTSQMAGLGKVSGTMSVLFNHGNGTFGSQSDYLTWNRALADLNGDGMLDVIRADATTATVKYGACLP